MGKLTLQDLAGVLIEKNGLDRQEALQFVTAIFDVVQDGLQNDRQVKIKGLGTFKMAQVEARESINVNTGERVIIGSHSKITFTPDSAMKDLVNKPFSGFETVILNDGVVFDDMPSTHSEKKTGTPDESLESDEIVEEKQLAVETPDATEEVDATAAIKEKTPIVSEEETSAATEEETSATTEEETSATTEEEASAATEEDTLSDEEEEPLPDYGMSKTSNKSKWLWPLGCLLFGGVCFFLGFKTSRYVDPIPWYIDTVSVSDSVQLVADSVAIVPTDSVVEAGKQKNNDRDTTKTGDRQKTVVTASNNDTEVLDYREYEKMDARVRTGAYRIVGLDRVIRTTPGETLGYIAGRLLGPDMVCYLEVFNGIEASNVALEAGTKIKIPKLESKKHAKKRESENQKNNNNK